MSKWQLKYFADDITESIKCPWMTLRQFLIICYNDAWWVRFDIYINGSEHWNVILLRYDTLDNTLI